jgi:hypothetical protein
MGAPGSALNLGPLRFAALAEEKYQYVKAQCNTKKR